MNSTSPTLLGILYGVIVMLSGALGYVGRLFITGQLVPRQTIDDLRADFAAVKAENQTWRATDAENNKTIRVLAGHVGEFVDITRTVGGVLQTLPAAAPARETEEILVWPWGKRKETPQTQGHTGLRDAERALVRSKDLGDTAAAFTPIVRRLAATFSDLRDARTEDTFGARIAQAIRDDQGPAPDAHRG